MKPRAIACVLFLYLLSNPFSHSLMAQEKDDVTKTILQKDSLFWIAYNNCDVEGMKQFFTDDVEFYHDKGGITLGLKNLSENTKNNLCGNDNFRLRREAVKGSVNVFPMKKGDTVYGAVISGEHVFYISEKGKQEYLDGIAKFTHLWMLKDGIWKMARILSYDHRAATNTNTRKEIQLPGKTLDQYTGKYNGPQTGTMTVQRADTTLLLLFKNQRMILYPETNNSFFTKERDLTFQFIKNNKREMDKMIIIEHGAVVEEAVMIK